MKRKTAKIIFVSAMLILLAITNLSCKKQQPMAELKSSEQQKACSVKTTDDEFDLSVISLQTKMLSASDVEKLEKNIETYPGDLVSRLKALGWYSRNRFKSQSARKGRYKHILWLIKNLPDYDLDHNFDTDLDPHLDEDAYYKARQLWLKQVSNHKANTVVIGNAAKFLLLYDREEAEKLYKQAIELEPDNPMWPERLGHLYNLRLIGKSGNSKTQASTHALEQLEKSLELSTTERNKFYKLADLAKTAFKAGKISKANDYAEELLSLSVKYRGDWNYGNAIHHGNIVLGRIAFKSGDIEKAKQYLLKAGETSGSPQLNSFGPNMMLAKELLEKNESQIVIQYFELCGIFWEMGQDRLTDWTDKVNKGVIPDFKTSLNH